MTVRTLDKSEWQAFCDHVSKELVGKRAEIEVTSLELGHQVEAKWWPVTGVVYDPKNDLFEIALENLDHLDHLVRRPRELYIDIGSTGLKYLDVVDGEGVLHHVEFRNPLMLPSRQPMSQQGAANRASGKI
jgi:hypothetical protein